ncbi:multidrug ABC transporter ATP-binding protein [Clostridia bacterium]|nr:multidrug ABC transporter ATP-binding protein [Clostridia bacterium]
MGKLLIYLKDYKKETILAPLFKMLEASFELLIPLVVAAMIDRGISGEDTFYLWHMGLLLLGLGVVGLISSVTAQYFSAKAAAGFASQLRRSLFAHVQGFSFAMLDRMGSSALVTRMTSDINRVQAGVNLVLRLLLRSPFVVFGAMLMAFRIDRAAGLIFLGSIALLFFIVFVIMLLGIPLYKKVQSHLERILTITGENRKGVRVIRAFRREKEETEAFYEENVRYTKMAVFAGNVTAILNPLSYVIVNGGLLLLLHLGAVQVNGGGLSQGQVVALVNYSTQVLAELIKFASLILTVNQAVASGNRIQGVFEMRNHASQVDEKKQSKKEAVHSTYDVNSEKQNQEKRNQEKQNQENQSQENQNQENQSQENQNLENQIQENSAPPFLEFQEVSFSYENAGEKALNNISFSAEKGEIIGIIGGTGSGKSTLVHLIPGFYEASMGKVLLNGQDVKQYPRLDLQKRIGIVPQTPLLFSGTIRDNILWGKEDASESELWEALELTQAAEVVKGKEGGLHARVEQGGKNFSGGQRQRLTIARALAGKPEILILDDSSASLDNATEAELFREILAMENRPLIILVAQKVSAIRHAHKILVLEEGEILAQGVHEELMKTCSVYREICGEGALP